MPKRGVQIYRGLERGGGSGVHTRGGGTTNKCNRKVCHACLCASSFLALMRPSVSNSVGGAHESLSCWPGWTDCRAGCALVTDWILPSSKEYFPCWGAVLCKTYLYIRLSSPPPPLPTVEPPSPHLLHTHAWTKHVHSVLSDNPQIVPPPIPLHR